MKMKVSLFEKIARHLLHILHHPDDKHNEKS